MTYRTPSPDADALVDEFERTILYTYDDATGKRMAIGQKPKGVPTIGRGNTRHAMPVRTITRDEAEAYYREDSAEAIETMYRHVPRAVLDSLPQPCFDALFSMTFNIGPQLFIAPGKKGKRTQFWTTLTTDLHAVPAQIARWVYDDGKKLAGLVRRREAEARLWLRGLAMLHRAEPEQDARIVPTPPQPAISTGPITERPAVGAATTAAGSAGAALTEGAQSMQYMTPDASFVLQLIFGAIAFAGLGLTVYAIVQQGKAGRA